MKSNGYISATFVCRHSNVLGPLLFKGSIEEIGLLYSVWQMIDTLNVLVPLGYFRVVNYRH